LSEITSWDNEDLVIFTQDLFLSQHLESQHFLTKACKQENVKIRVIS